MSRRRGEFEHRTSLFEGAYRAWSHLGGLNPDDLFAKSPEELDPLNMSTEPVAGPALSKNESTKGDSADASGVDANESVASVEESASKKEDGDSLEATSMNPNKRDWRYEPLPRSGLEHPYVRSIINPWLGPDSEDPDEVEQGLATLRNWWQHRRKGESRSAVSALGTDKMRGTVDGYTRQFFKLALELVKRNKAHPPKSLMAKMGGPKSERNRRHKPKRKKDHSKDEEEVGDIMTSLAGAGSPEGARGGASLSVGLPVFGSLEGLTGPGTAAVGSAASALKDRNLSLLACLGSAGSNPFEQTASALDLLLQQQRHVSLDPLELAQIVRQRQLMAASSVFGPLEQLHLLQRERQLAWLGSNYGASLATSSLSLPQSSAGLTNYSPPSWLLEPLARNSTDLSPDDKDT
jgi:hypothetical protein